jgi:hypothetical protein
VGQVVGESVAGKRESEELEISETNVTWEKQPLVFII